MKLYRFLLCDGDARVADALTRAIRNDPPMAEKADNELRSLPRAKRPRQSRSAHRVLARLLRAALRSNGDEA